MLTREHLYRMISHYVPELAAQPRLTEGQWRLFQTATTHPSAHRGHGYQRLEYLGDAVYHWAVTDYLYHRYEDQREGFLTSLRISLERGSTMTLLFRELGLEGTIQSLVPITDDIMEDVLEAWMGAFYLVYGPDHSRTLVVACIEKHLDIAQLICDDQNYKRVLLYYCHRQRWGNTEYRTSWKGRQYQSRVYVPGQPRHLSTGHGETAKEAEQEAVQRALVKYGIIVDGQLRLGWEDDLPPEAEEEEPQERGCLPHNPANQALTASKVRELLRRYHLSPPGRLPIAIFAEAMVHSSYVGNRPLTREEKEEVRGLVPLAKKSNDRLQYLGTAVIHLYLSAMLYRRYPRVPEGTLTVYRSRLERREQVQQLATDAGLAPYLLVSRVLEDKEGASRRVIGGALTAWMGALYLAYGLQTAETYYREVLEAHVPLEQTLTTEDNYRLLTRQWCGQAGWALPRFRVLSESGPDHQKSFRVGMYIGDTCVSKGVGVSKKSAEHEACRIFLDKVREKGGESGSR